MARPDDFSTGRGTEYPQEMHMVQDQTNGAKQENVQECKESSGHADSTCRVNTSQRPQGRRKHRMNPTHNKKGNGTSMLRGSKAKVHSSLRLTNAPATNGRHLQNRQHGQPQVCADIEWHIPVSRGMQPVCQETNPASETSQRSSTNHAENVQRIQT